MAAYYMIRYKYLPVIRRQRSTMAAYYMIRNKYHPVIRRQGSTMAAYCRKNAIVNSKSQCRGS